MVHVKKVTKHGTDYIIIIYIFEILVHLAFV